MNTQQQKTSNDLRLKLVRKTKEGHTIEINIRLNDECKNGPQDFSITGTIWEKNQPKIDRYMIRGGAIGDYIAQEFPELAIFNDLHLSDRKGVPMYAIGNGFYHIKNNPEYVKDHLHVNDDELKTILTAEDETHLHILVHNMKLPERWQEMANKAIKYLEDATGLKFVDDSIKTQYTPPTPDAITEFTNKMERGYYTPEQREKRKKSAKLKTLNKERAELKAELEKEIKKAQDEYNIKIAVLNTGLPISNFIYYHHTNEGAFNWNTSTYNKEVTWEQFIEFLARVDKTNLPNRIKFILKDKK